MMGWLAPPGVDGAGEGGEVRKKMFTVTFISNLINYRRIRDLTLLWWPHASLINITDYVSGGKLNIY